MRARLASSSSARPTRTPWRSATRISARARFFMLARISSSLTDVSTITVWRYCDARAGCQPCSRKASSSAASRGWCTSIFVANAVPRSARIRSGQRRDVGRRQAADPRQVLEQPEALGQPFEDEHGIVAFGAEAAPGHMPWTRRPHRLPRAGLHEMGGGVRPEDAIVPRDRLLLRLRRLHSASVRRDDRRRLPSRLRSPRLLPHIIGNPGGPAANSIPMIPMSTRHLACRTPPT